LCKRHQPGDQNKKDKPRKNTNSPHGKKPAPETQLKLASADGEELRKLRSRQTGRVRSQPSALRSHPMKLVDSNRIVKRFALLGRARIPPLYPPSHLFLAVILSAAKDPEGPHSFTVLQLFPTRLSTAVSTIHPMHRHFRPKPLTHNKAKKSAPLSHHPITNRKSLRRPARQDHPGAQSSHQST
jgi:hypothetical protein